MDMRKILTRAYSKTDLFNKTVELTDLHFVSISWKINAPSFQNFIFIMSKYLNFFLNFIFRRHNVESYRNSTVCINLK